MTNHYHLLVETLEANLSRGMRQLNGVYTQWFNRIHHRVGHVFQGRYKKEKGSDSFLSTPHSPGSRVGVAQDKETWFSSARFLDPGTTPAIGINQFAREYATGSPFGISTTGEKLTVFTELRSTLLACALRELAHIRLGCIVDITKRLRLRIGLVELWQILGMGGSVEQQLT